VLRVEELRKSFGGVSAMNGVSLTFEAGSLTAIIGPNGAGKTTFFNLITGAFRPDSGRPRRRLCAEAWDAGSRSRASFRR
jgi:branched-chain amino acid transport system ATP-binding protein